MKISKLTVGIIVWILAIIGSIVFLPDPSDKTAVSFFLTGPVFALLILCGGVLLLAGFFAYWIFFGKDTNEKEREKRKYGAGVPVAIGLFMVLVISVSKIFLGNSFMSSVVYGVVFAMGLYFVQKIQKK